VTRLWRSSVRFGFRLLYQEFAFCYDFVSWVASMGAWRCWMEASLRHLPPGNPVLELAHGPGHLQVSLMAREKRSYGIDYSLEMGWLAHARLSGRGDPARLACARAQALPYPAGTFAAVISTFPSDFITDPATLSEVRRVLRSGAPLIIVPSASFTSGGVAKAALGLAYRATGQNSDSHASHERIAHFLEPHGFTVDVFEEPCPRSLALVVVARKSL